MKYLVMCEGPNEKAVMDILLEHHLLKFSENDLLGLVTYHARQIATSAQVRTALNLYPGDIRVLRIGDKQSDALRIPSAYRAKISSIEKFCTKPELEMLLILAEGLEKAYVKVKSKTRAKTFAKENVTAGGRNYDNSTAFYRLYFENRPDLLVRAIRRYRETNGSHAKDEHYLAELLK